MSVAPGQQIAGYRVVAQLGSGAMGDVYIVENPHLMRREAMKVISVGGSSNPDFQQRFTNEARTAAALDHPSIITVYAYGVENDAPWFTMSYLDGPDLSSERLSAADVITVVGQVADALDYAHARQVVHRDIKPANIVITREDDGTLRRAVVLDFGIARLSDSPQLTAANSVVGTMAYTAPEIISGHAADARSDQYSLACTTYTMLAGTSPFHGDTSASIMMAHLQQPVPSIAQVRPDLAPLAPVLQRAMDKNPANRYPDCRSFAADLQRALAHTQAGTSTTVAPVPLPGGHTSHPSVPGSQPGFRSQPGHGSQPGFGAQPGYGSQPSVPGYPQPGTLPDGTMPMYPPSQPGQPVGAHGWAPMAGMPGQPGGVPPKKSKKGLFVGLGVLAVAIIAVAATSPLWWPKSDPAPVVATASSQATLASYLGTLCAIEKSALYCWGGNSEGQLGDGSENDRITPAAIGTLKDVTAVALGGYNEGDEPEVTTCAVAENDAYCWGAGLFGVLGNNSSSSSSVPLKVNGLGKVTAISTDKYTTCAISDGDVWCWGWNSRGEGGSNSDAEIEMPTKVNGIADVTSLSVRSGNTCAVTKQQELFCWGDNYNGQLGNGNTDRNPVPAKVDGLGKVTSVSVGSGTADKVRFNQVCAVSDGDVYCWGATFAGDSSDVTPQLSPKKIDGLPGGATTVSTDINTMCATADDKAYCWGNDRLAQAGNNAASDVISTPTEVRGLGKVTAVVTGTSTSCAMSDDQTYCWGFNGGGRIGDGSQPDPGPNDESPKVPNPVRVAIPE
ncbi:protein kinase domain-containing protein [Gordonia alkaliphila]|uniref:non-specific serine/threonine protein kinase n=1 Tax=Gordonia alkaliphila TaxID=1053547 RepID=A0ABP8Z6I2_9ACTN